MNMKFKALSQNTVEDHAAEEASLADDIASEARERGKPMIAPEKGSAAQAGVVNGVLLEHGVGKPSATAPVSYFMKIDTGGKEPVTYWGDDLKKVIDAAALQAGDTVTGALKDGSWELAGAQPAVSTPEPVAAGENVTATPAAPAAAPKSNAAGFSALMQYSAGKRDVDDVKIEAPAAAAKSVFASVPEADEEAVVDIFKNAAKSAKKAAKQPDQDNAAPVAAGTLATGNAAALIGQAVAGVFASPFIAYSSAARHLKQQFGAKPAPSQAKVASKSMMDSMPLSVGNTMEAITNWKCERIERAGVTVRNAFDALAEIDGFSAWQKNVSEAADFHGLDSTAVIAQMHTNETFSPLREEMTQLWREHPKQVDAYRRACDEFERNISNNVVKEFPNSDEKTRGRVTTAMKDVAALTELLPGYGDQVDQYRKTLAERVRDIAASIQDFVNSLLSKATGSSSPSSELTV